MFFAIAFYAIRNVKAALMFTITIGIPLSYVLRTVIMGRIKKKEEDIIDVTKEVVIETKKDNKKNINVTINLNVNDENFNKDDIKKAVNDVIDAAMEKEEE